MTQFRPAHVSATLAIDEHHQVSSWDAKDRPSNGGISPRTTMETLWTDGALLVKLANGQRFVAVFHEVTDDRKDYEVLLDHVAGKCSQ